MPRISTIGSLISLLTSVSVALAQKSSALPNTYPHNYTGIPSGDYGTDWQDCASLESVPCVPY